MNSLTLPVESGPLELLERDDDTLLSIPHVERLPPFLMSVLSSTDLWMFVASNGGLTAGRVSAEHSLFPYETSDRLYERPGLGGPITLIRTSSELWSPFDLRSVASGVVRRLSKSALGDRVVFEELHESLGLGFRYEWAPSEKFGWVRSARLWTTTAKSITVEILDGLLDLLPAGVALTTQQRASNLVDAYRHSELHNDHPNHLALYSLSSLLTDRAEPAEALRTNVVWRCGLPGTTFLSPDVVSQWRHKQPLTAGTHLRGRKGAYLVSATVTVEPGRAVDWEIVGDVSLDAVKMASLRAELEQDGIPGRLSRSLEESRRDLETLVGSIDGYQCSGDAIIAMNHVSNALFNGLRGGVLVDESQVPKDELRSFVSLRNRSVAERNSDWIEQQPAAVDLETLRRSGASRGDAQLSRLVDEVLPLAFGRRHGDPSRPWNRFSIRTKTEDGRRALHYEGNWRDIFQNWEALAISYPDALPSMIAKFVNALTVDGFNPYRISREGIDWEVPDPEDPWSNIGYWGDHQVVYLLRLLEALHRYRPEMLMEMLDDRRFSFADVPYRICSYEQMLKNPRDTIVFDEAHEETVQARVAQIGMDGRLVWQDGEVALTHLWEKLLIPLLSKLSNLVVDGGIWMNTQRPEWNDANNALPGYGLSVVTLAHTLRFTGFLRRLISSRDRGIAVNPIVHRWLQGTAEVLAELRGKTSAVVTPSERRETLDRLGRVFSAYRDAAYQGWPADSVEVPIDEIKRFLDDASEVMGTSFRANVRNDGLFHSYNTMTISPTEVHIHHLPPMLEGQVAALDAQVLPPAEAAGLVDAMYASPLYRPDQDTFLLYPDKTLPDFEARNRVSAEAAQAIPIVARWLQGADTRIIAADRNGQLHFHADLKNAEVLDERLDKLAQSSGPITDADRSQLHALFEQTFTHAEFTGRSTSMYGYEGLGCVYWHMVAKLLVAVQESFLRAHQQGDDTDALANAYHRVRQGFGFNKSPTDYGAFPTDAYSHTPGHSGAQQPGMTGQVKEQVLTRFGELGVRVERGAITFDPVLLRRDELLVNETEWSFTASDGQRRTERLPAGSLGFTLAGVPIIYRTLLDDDAQGERIVITPIGQHEPKTTPGLRLDAPATRELFGRGAIARIDVWLDTGRRLHERGELK